MHALKEEVEAEPSFLSLVKFFCSTLEQFLFFIQKFLLYLFTEENDLLASLAFFKINGYLQRHILVCFLRNLRNNSERTDEEIKYF